MLQINNLFKAWTISVANATTAPDDDDAHYAIIVTNKSSGVSATVEKSTADFHTFCDTLCVTLDPGHACDGLCPWFYAHVNAKKPKAIWFLPPTDARLVKTNVKTFQALFDAMLGFLASSANRACPRAMHRVPAALVRFLFDNQDVDHALFESAPPLKRKSSTERVCSSDAFSCSLCSHAHANGVTTLACGHAFHDECILEALNRQLQCPACMGNV
ncbi:Aste57867_15933 [Aphanomyces stellatus]|uniref:Aste57867_15933 protein n=1 Tax=Aphanomyces stellatus TaxID=120398 RepID=A0A485L497_9STRA|nr:hypothetical protein As57867_015877 [Aphanomyces stellatus]VFT92719.1 Aste57867_15933 [Aphanomyces stellatus]